MMATMEHRAATLPLLSVVVPTRDRPALLREALTSVTEVAGGDLAGEVIGVDASPGEPSAAGVAADFGAAFLRAPGASSSAARNVGMARARGEYLLFLDDDDVVLAGHLRPHLELLRRRPELAGVFGQVRLADFELAERGEPFPDPDEVGHMVTYLLGRPHQIGSWVFRTSLRDGVGPFDESLAAAQDWDWLLRVALGHPVAFVPVPCLLFRQRRFGTSDSLNLMRLRYMRRVFLRNAWRAGAGQPSVLRRAQLFVHHNGVTAGHFLNSLRLHERAGDSASVRYAFRGALASSPPHTAWRLARERGLIAIALRAHLRPGRRPAAAPRSSA
jgi:glycosyltransferase involved in cell wall biosynthesis